MKQINAYPKPADEQLAQIAEEEEEEERDKACLSYDEVITAIIDRCDEVLGSLKP